MKKLSCLIPLYRSRRFLEIIRANIDAHLELGAEIIVSDRHLLDDTTTVLSDIYGNNSSVRIVSARDELDWVGNINFLISECTGDYFRITPHDDTATTESSSLLVDALVRDTSAILAYGKVRAVTLDGQHLPDKDHANASESPGVSEWSIEDALSLFWKGRFGGAFKGVVRASAIRASNLLIKKTPTLAHAERAWLFALAVKGPFTFVPESVLVKRYYEDSTHRGWQNTGQSILDVTMRMRDYCVELVEDNELQRQASFNLLVNGYRRAAWVEARKGHAPSYLSPQETTRLLRLRPC